MKKTFVLAMALLLTISLLSACGDGGGASDNGSASNNDTGTSGLVNGKVDLLNRNSYYLIIDGHKYGLKTTVQDIINDGYTIKYELDKEVKPNTFLDLHVYKNGEWYFSMHAVNRTDNIIPLAKCTVRELEVQDEWNTTTTFIGGLHIGSSKEDVIAVFGNDNEVQTDTFYVYYSREQQKDPDLLGVFYFNFNESGKVRGVRFTVMN